MRTYSLQAGRAQFSALVDRALAGEPQRVTRHGKDAVVIVSEAEWNRRPKAAATLGALLAAHAQGQGFTPDDFDRPWKNDRDLGANFAD